MFGPIPDFRPHHRVTRDAADNLSKIKREVERQSHVDLPEPLINPVARITGRSTPSGAGQVYQYSYSVVHFTDALGGLRKPLYLPIWADELDTLGVGFTGGLGRNPAVERSNNGNVPIDGTAFVPLYPGPDGTWIFDYPGGYWEVVHCEYGKWNVYDNAGRYLRSEGCCYCPEIGSGGSGGICCAGYDLPDVLYAPWHGTIDLPLPDCVPFSRQPSTGWWVSQSYTSSDGCIVTFVTGCGLDGNWFLRFLLGGADSGNQHQVPLLYSAVTCDPFVLTFPDYPTNHIDSDGVGGLLHYGVLGYRNFGICAVTHDSFGFTSISGSFAGCGSGGGSGGSGFVPTNCCTGACVTSLGATITNKVGCYASMPDAEDFTCVDDGSGNHYWVNVSDSGTVCGHSSAAGTMSIACPTNGSPYFTFAGLSTPAQSGYTCSPVFSAVFNVDDGAGNSCTVTVFQ